MAEEVRKKLGLVKDLWEISAEMREKGYELDRVEGDTKNGFYAVYKRVV